MKAGFAATCLVWLAALAVFAGAAGAGEGGGVAAAADAATAAGSAAPPLAAAFAPAPARRPYIGEWLEYRICYPVDPLENAMGAAPIAPAAQEPETPDVAAAAENAAATQASGPDGTEQEYVYLPPASTPATAWIELPLRLEIVQVDDDACRAVMSFGRLRREVVLPNRGEAGEDDEEKFVFDPPQADDTEQVLQLDGEGVPCRLTRREGGGYGFARLWSVELPFGLARFATGDVDIVLVGKGTGLPPAFPLPLREKIHPAPGLFYVPEVPSTPPS